MDQETAADLLHRSLAADDGTLVDETVQAWQEMVEQTPPGAEDRPSALAALGLALYNRFRHTSDYDDIDAAIELGAEAVALAGADHYEAAAFRAGLAASVCARYRGDQDPEDFATLRRLVDEVEARWEESGELVDLDAAVAVRQQLVWAVPEDDPEHVEQVFELAALQYLRAWGTGDADEAAAKLAELREMAAGAGPRRAKMLTDLAALNTVRYMSTGDADDLGNAIEDGRAAVAAAGDAERADALTNLATALRNRADRHGGTLADLDESIELSRAAAALIPADDPRWAAVLFNLGATLHIRYTHAGRPEDLDAAVEALRDAVAAAPLGHSSHVMALSSLGLALRSQYERSHDPADLDQAIEAGSQAVRDLEPDEPGADAYQRNLDMSIMLRWCAGQRSGNQVDTDRHDEFVEQFAAQATGATRLALSDTEHGVEVIDELLNLVDGVPALAETVAGLKYNRAAVHRDEQRRAEALHGYLDVAAEFGGHPDPDVRFWVALALYNAATLVIETEQPDVADQVPRLIARLRVEAAGQSHPRVLRRLREGLRLEAEVLAAAGRPDESAAAIDQLRAHLRPLVDEVVAALDEMDPPEPPNPASPRWPSPRDSVVAVLADRFDELLDVVRAIADAPPSELIEMLEPYPELLSDVGIAVVMSAANGRIPGAVSDADVLERGLGVLGQVIEFLSADPANHPLGEGRLEQLMRAVDVQLSLADALADARTPPAIATLSMPYASALVEEGSMRLLKDGDWRRALRLHLLLLAAAERAPDTEEGRAVVSIARHRWLWVARDVLLQLPDARVLHSAVDAGERLLAHPGLGTKKAEVLYQLASLHLSPHANLYTGSDEDTIILGGYRRWLDRLAEEVSDPVELPDGAEPALPGIEESVDIGGGYLRRALACATPELAAPIRSLLLIEHKIRRELGFPRDLEELRSIVEESLTSDDLNLLANALITQQQLDGEPDAAALERLLSRSFEEISAQPDGNAAVSALLSAGQLLQSSDRARGRRLFADLAEHVRGLDETVRTHVLQVHQQLLRDPADLADIDRELPAVEAASALLDRAGAQGWPVERTAVAMLTLAGWGHRTASGFEAEEAWLRTVEVLLRMYPDELAGHADAITFQVAGWRTQVSSRAHHDDDWEHSVRAQAAACAGFLDLNMPDGVMESLTLIKTSVDAAGGAGLSTAVAESLWPLVVRAENLLGARATAVLQPIWSVVVGTAFTEEQVGALFACLQLAKGARFADALHASAAYDARTDTTATELLAAIAAIGSGAGADVDLDAFTLVTPYTEQLDVIGAVTPAHQRENLERTFDAHVQRELSGQGTAKPRLLGPDKLIDLLPEDTVLWSIFLCHDEQGGRSLLSVLARHGRFAVVAQPVLDAQGATEVMTGTIDGRVRSLDPMAMVVDRMRRAVLAEPGPVRPVSRLSEDALADGLLAMFGPVTDLLREELADGRRHLVVVPHGALHFAPLHLLYFDDKPLAESFTVTYLPNLALLDRSLPTVPDRPLTAVGLGFTSGPLPPIPEAVDEAAAIASVYGTSPLLDADATEEAVLGALERSGLFHIATHGTHNVAAPAFQSLHVADERVSAHELLRLDLSGLDLITLSACETALGRFDAADNLRGIPANLLVRGARAIVGTLWPVETRTSREFFVALYGSLRAGSSRLDAFAAAVERTRAAHPQYRDWGAFYYAGDWR